VAYDAAVRVWYGPESYQHALWRKPTAHTIGVTAPKPCIVYRPGGGWAGADVADLESRLWWYYSLNDATSGYDSTYQVFVLNTASVGYNRAKVTGLTAWVTATAYADGDFRGRAGLLWQCVLTHTSGDASAPSDVWTTGRTYVAGDTVIRRTVTKRQYICILGHVASSTSEAGLGVDTATYWTDVSPATAWADATAYVVGNVRESGGSVYYCVANHLSAVGTNDPATGTAWEPVWHLLGTTDNHNGTAYWREIVRNETGQRQVADLGECTPGGLDEAVGNVQQFIGWLRRNAATYGVNPDQICVAGASAGGQLAGCVAYAESIPWAKDSQIYGAARDAFYTSTRPNAALLTWTPVDLVRHTVYGLKNGLYGEDSNDAGWVARPADVKRAMSPLYTLKRTGLAVPTCLDFLGQGTHTLNVFTGLTGEPYHHPDNGGLLMQYLAAARTTGLGQTGHIFFDDTSAGVYRYRTTYTSATVSAGTVGDLQEPAELMIAWLNAALGV
jgi:acetyl esterase/lipase